MRITKRFSWHPRSGDFAEKYFRKVYLPSLGLNFRKIRKDKKGSKPDGWILLGKKKIALAEIKLITYNDRSETAHKGVVKITIDETIQHAISSAKKQLKNIKTILPKILYLILDDPFANSKSILDATFGPWITVECAGKTVYNGQRGFHPRKKYPQDNKILGDWLSAMLCLIPDTERYKLLLFRPQNSIKLPDKILPIETIEETWEYSENSLIQTKSNNN